MSENLFLLTFFSPFIFSVLLGVLFFTKIKIPEYILSETVKWFSLYMATISLALFVLSWINSPSRILLDYAPWIEVEHYQFKVRFIIDLLGASYAMLSAALIGIIFRFSRNYLHKEEGYFRFIFLLSILQFGLIIVSFSRSIDLLFAGWELVGTTSVLLISYFYAQVQPVRHSVKAIISYRICDMGILAAGAWAHHYLHSTDFTVLPNIIEHSHSGIATITIGAFIIWGAIAKSGQLPMSSWLPTAMEGPTPSSAIFYGALSVHLGPFLLIRFHDYFSHFPALLWAIGIIGGMSAIYATLVGRTRSDAKTMLGYATISQVGIIWIEIALGFTNFALFHMITHASLRTWQFLRSNSIMHDFYENPAVQQNVKISRQMSFEKFFTGNFKKKVYVHALHAFHLDYFTMKILSLISLPFRIFIKFENKWMEWDTRFLNRLLRKGNE